MHNFKKPLFVRWINNIHFLLKPCSVAKDKKHLPDFLIIGAQKCGTTALWHNLNLHPEVFMVERRDQSEVQFFSSKKNWYRGLDWYMSHFPHPEYLQGEKSAEYLFRQSCHEKIRWVIPHAKLIILIRNPVNRAYSQWNHYNQVYYTKSKHWGWKITDFETALSRYQDLRVRGQYIDQIENLLKYFPREKIYIGIAERLKKNPEYEINKVLSFLGISQVPIQYANLHSRNYPREMKKETRTCLYEHFREYNKRLYEFLGEQVSEWEEQA